MNIFRWSLIPNIKGIILQDSTSMSSETQTPSICLPSRNNKLGSCNKLCFSTRHSLRPIFLWSSPIRHLLISSFALIYMMNFPPMVSIHSPIVPNIPYLLFLGVYNTWIIWYIIYSDHILLIIPPPHYLIYTGFRLRWTFLFYLILSRAEGRSIFQIQRGRGQSRPGGWPDFQRLPQIFPRLGLIQFFVSIESTGHYPLRLRL